MSVNSSDWRAINANSDCWDVVLEHVASCFKSMQWEYWKSQKTSTKFRRSLLIPLGRHTSYKRDRLIMKTTLLHQCLLRALLRAGSKLNRSLFSHPTNPHWSCLSPLVRLLSPEWWGRTYYSWYFGCIVSCTCKSANEWRALRIYKRWCGLFAEADPTAFPLATTMHETPVAINAGASRKHSSSQSRAVSTVNIFSLFVSRHPKYYFDDGSVILRVNILCPACSRCGMLSRLTLELYRSRIHFIGYTSLYWFETLTSSRTCSLLAMLTLIWSLRKGRMMIILSYFSKIKRSLTAFYHSIIPSASCWVHSYRAFLYWLDAHSKLLFSKPRGVDILTFLQVAEQWQFLSQKAASLEMLKTHGSAIEKIVASRTYTEAKDWLVPAFAELAKKLTPPRREEGILLGADDLLNLWYIQSYRRSCGRDEHVNGFIRHLVLEGGSPEYMPATLSHAAIFS